MPARIPNTQSLLNLYILVLFLCVLGSFGFIAPENQNTPTQTAPSTTPENSTTTSQAPDPDEIKECVVTFLNGRKLTGLLMSSGVESIVLRINGIDTTYRRAKIASVNFLPPIRVRFQQFRNALQDNDIDGRLLLVDWLRDRRAYELAVEELESILLIEPDHPQAKILKTWLEQHLKLKKKRIDRSKTIKKRSAPIQHNAVPLLTKEQINLIRVYELDLADPPKFKIHDSTIKELMARSPDAFPVDQRQREAIMNGSELDKLKLLFRHKARDLYPQIQILEDPASFQSFKKHLAGKTGWLLNSCATARCHGG
jgi:hypothetical protein